MAAAAACNPSPGAGAPPQATAEKDNGGDSNSNSSSNNNNSNSKDVGVYASSLRALQDLADALPGFRTRLESKADLEARQQVLVQAGGSVEQTGMGAEQVQLRIGERVGEGTFCVVYRAELLPGTPATPGTLGAAEPKAVAAKFELRKTDSTQLRNEYRMYKKLSNSPGIANIYCFGEMDFHKVLVMDLLGPSLESYFQHCGRRFSIKTVCMLAKQMISRVQTIHEHDLIYRDIKPENFLMGLPASKDAGLVHLIDYGMAKPYRDADTKQHIPYGESQSLSGTARYMSINAHRRCMQSRRDDIEAVGHVLLYFARGSLPWQGGPKTAVAGAAQGAAQGAAPALQHEQRYDQMCEKKQATTIHDLCHGCPPEFAAYLTYARGLAFDAAPDYDYLRGLFSKVLDGLGAIDDGVYDWTKPVDDTEASPAASPAATTTTPPSPPSPPHPAAANNKTEDVSPSAAMDIPSATTAATPTPDTIPPGSPPGAKRGRSEFVSELRPPTRSRPKKSSRHVFYDSAAQRALSTLCRDIMAKRYAFHRAVKQLQQQRQQSQQVSAASAALMQARVAAAHTDKKGHLIPLRRVGSAGTAPGTPTPVIAQAFMDGLDHTLSKAIHELEEMSDRLLRNGDWSGAPRVQAWIAEVEEAVRAEMQRVRVEMQAVVPEKTTPAPQPLPPIEVTQAQIDPMGPNDASLPEALEVDTAPDVGISKLTGMSLRDQFGGRRGIGFAPTSREVVGVSEVVPTVEAATIAAPPRASSTPAAGSSPLPAQSSSFPRSSPSAAVRVGIHELTLAATTTTTTAAASVDDPIAVDDTIEADDGTADDTEMLELVYRTASGMRKVMRVPRNG